MAAASLTPAVAFAGLGMGIAGTSMAGVSLTRLNDMGQQTQTNKLILNEITISGTPGASIAWLYADTSDNLHFFTLNGGDQIIDSTGGPFLPLSGGTMGGDIDMNGFSLQQVLQLVLANNGSPATPSSGLQLYSTSDVLYSIDSSALVKQYVTLVDLDAYLLLSGASAMNGNLNVNGNFVTNPIGIVLLDNNVPAPPSANHLTLYEDGNVLFSIDSSSTIRQFATLTDLGDYLLTSGANQMLANLNFGNFFAENAAGVILQENAVPSPPSANHLTLYDDNDVLYSIDSSSLVKEYATVAALGNYLLTSGANMMLANLNFNSNFAENASGVILVDTGLPSTPSVNHLTLFEVSNTLQSIDSTSTVRVYATVADLSDYLLTSGANMMLANLNFNDNFAENASGVILVDLGIPSAPTSNHITLYEVSNVLYSIDGSSTIKQYATIADLSSYLQLAGGTMSGAIGMGDNYINNVGGMIFTDDATPNVPAAGHLTIHANANDLYSFNSSSVSKRFLTDADTLNYLSLDGLSTMAGHIQMGGFNILNSHTIYVEEDAIVNASMYSQYASTTVNTGVVGTDETEFSNGSATGALSLTNVGISTYIEIYYDFDVTVPLPTAVTLYLRLKLNGATLIQQSKTWLAGLTNSPASGRYVLTVQTATLDASGTILYDFDGTVRIIQNNVAFTPAATNTFTVTAEFDNAPLGEDRVLTCRKMYAVVNGRE